MNSSSIWAEKYRPRTFAEMVGQESIVQRLKAFVEKQNMPHLLLIGPAGVGKTTLALIIAGELYKENRNQNFLELNASDERGIDVIRNKVKDFAKTISIQNAPFKIVYLDECDSLTREAQQALRRTMETYSNSCRFILSCNYSSKIIEPIKSRCTIFKFRPLEKNSLDKIMGKIAKNEGITLTPEAREIIIRISSGDVRQLENMLQACASATKAIDKNTLYDITAETQPEEIKDVLNLALKSSFIQAKDKLLKIMLENGLSGLDIIKEIQKEILGLEISDKKKLEMIEKCGETEFRIVEGSDDFIQLQALLASFCSLGCA